MAIWFPDEFRHRTAQSNKVCGIYYHITHATPICWSRVHLTKPPAVMLPQWSLWSWLSFTLRQVGWNTDVPAADKLAAYFSVLSLTSQSSGSEWLDRLGLATSSKSLFFLMFDKDAGQSSIEIEQRNSLCDMFSTSVCDKNPRLLHSLRCDACRIHGWYCCE